MSLTGHLGRTWDRDGSASALASKSAFMAFAEEFGSVLIEVSGRQAEIDALPCVEWRGRRLRTLRCHGVTGRGPHDVNVPEALLWSLMHFGAFRCPYHA